MIFQNKFYLLISHLQFQLGKLQYKPLSDALKKFNQDLTSEWTDEQYEIVYQSLEMLQKRFELDNR